MRTALALLALSAGALAGQSKEIRKTLPLNADGDVEISTYKGSVRVSTWDRAEVDLVVRIEEDNDFGFLSQPVDAAELRIDARQTEVRLRSHYFTPGILVFTGSRPLFHYTLKMPRTARLKIEDHKSEIAIEGLAGELQLDTYKGTARIRDLSGALMLHTYKGDVHAEFASFNARSSIDTYKGDIDLALPRSAGFELHTDFDRRADLTSDFSQVVRASSRGRRSTTGLVNGGGQVLSLKSHKGYFRLRAR
jgi:hypothetical protein